jgi:monofunctional glycosyltransferase
LKNVWHHVVSNASRMVALLLLSALALQLYFLVRVALMTVVDPQSTSFERSEAWRLLTQKPELLWHQEWVGVESISPQLKRAVIAAEDAGFTDHSGVDWDALENAWNRNQKAQARAAKPSKPQPNKPGKLGKPLKLPKLVGGSTITQQLAKNLFLDGERSLVRKAQELPLTLMLEAVLSKERILEIYLNNVEWGEGVFGAQAAARHYFHVDARKLTTTQSARLAVMLPAPKRFEKNPASAYLLWRAATINARMAAVDVP